MCLARTISVQVNGLIDVGLSYALQMFESACTVIRLGNLLTMWQVLMASLLPTISLQYPIVRFLTHFFA